MKNFLFKFFLSFHLLYCCDLNAQKEGESCADFSVTEQIVDCKLRLTFTATSCLNCVHQWSIGSCGMNQTLTGATVSFFVSNVNSYLGEQIPVSHVVSCNGSITTYAQNYILKTQGIFIGEPGAFNSILPATTLVGCNNLANLLNEVIVDKKIFISSTIEFDKPSQVFANCDVCMDPGTSLIVGKNNSLTTNVLTLLYSTVVHNAISGSQQSGIWKGIEVKNNGKLRILDSKITGALIGVNIKNNSGARIELQRSRFENNMIGFSGNSPFVNEGIKGNTFAGPYQGNNSLPMAPAFPSISLDSYISQNFGSLTYSPIERPLAGIYLQNSILNIFDVNYFENLCCGIVLRKSSSEINSCEFKNIVIGYNSNQYSGNGISIIHLRPYNTYRNVDANNKFYGCNSSGIFLSNNVPKTFFKSSGFRNYNVQINGYNLRLYEGLIIDPINSSDFSSITASAIRSKEYGIKGLGFSPTSKNYFKIESNTFFVGNSSSGVRRCIWLDKVNSTDFMGNPSISVSKNKFYGDPFVEPDGKIVNIDFFNMKNAQIYFNDMDSELFGLLNNVTGVLTEGSQNIRIDCNKMLGRETDVSTAFMIKNTIGVSLTDNITSFTSEGIHFSGVCETADIGVRFNSLYHHDYGLTYDADASTNEQNNGPNSNGNVWVSDWEPNSGYIGARHFGDIFQVGLSTYRVPSSPSTQNPTSFALMPGVSPVDWFPLGVAFWDDYTCPEGNLAPDTIIRKITTLDRKIATQQLGLPDTTPEGYLWLMEDYLYRKVKDNPGIANNETAVTTFVSAKQSQPIGQLYEVKQGIEHLYESSNSANAAIIDTITKAIHLCIVDIARIDSILLDTTLSPTLRENKISYRIDKLTNFQLLQDSLDHLMAIRNQGISGVVSNLLSQNNAIMTWFSFYGHKILLILCNHEKGNTPDWETRTS